jgi:class 3 adenylate cyclase/tetratricopeptide (TPR) repeat protein
MTDIEGSTDLQSRLGDAAARALVRNHEGRIRDALNDYGGREIKTMGDGFLVSFASTRRALECACAIQRSLTEDPDAPKVRMGLHAGEVLVEGDDIHGAAISAAARIMGQARGGEILASDLVRQLAGAAGLDFKERRPITLKGLDGTWVLHEVVWRAADDDSRSATRTRAGEGSLLGRDAETATLRSAVDAAAEGRGRVVLLAGEPGIGKTSLAVDCARYADQVGVRVLWGACWEGEGAPAFWPWIQALRTYAGQVDDGDLTRHVGPGAGDILRLLPELAPRLPDVPPPPELDPEQARFRLFDAVASLLCRAAAQRPALVILDDLHWADESSLLLLSFVAAQLATNPVAMVGTYRSTEVGTDTPIANVLHDVSRRGRIVSLGGLDTDGVAALMASTAGTQLREELAAAVHRQTGGNPLFVGEVTRLLAVHNALDRTDVSVGVPAGVREVIERRMVRLPQRCIELLTLAAIVGEEFALDVVAAAASTSVAELVEQLEVGVTQGVARESGVGRYRFAHSLFREALYEGQGAIGRARLHLQVANALEAQSLERGGVAAAELANHFGQAALADESKKAVHYAALAGEEATRALAYAEAVAHYERAIAVLDLVGGSESERAELLLDLGAARWRAGDRNAAHADIMRAVELARRTDRKDVLASGALALRSLGGLSGIADNERIQILEEARQLLGEEETSLRARVLAGLAQERYHSWQPEEESERPVALAAEAVELARRLDDPATLAAALLARHDASWVPGHAAERLDVAVELAQAARQAGDRELATEALLLQATALLERSDARAIGRLEEFVVQAEQLHQAHFDYLVATRRVTLALVRGDMDAFDRRMEEAQELARAHDEPDAHLVESVQLGGQDILTGQHPDNVELSRRSERGLGYEELWVLKQALALIADGEPERARDMLGDLDVDDMERRYIATYGWLWMLAHVAEASAKVGDVELMRAAEERLRPHAGTCVVVAGGVSFLGCVSHYLGLIYAGLGRPADAAAAFEEALAAYDRLGARAWAERTRGAMVELDGRTMASVDAELVRQGPFWMVRYGSDECRVKDTKGVRDLAVLVAAPNREVPAAELMAQGMAVDAGGADAVLDERARRQFQERLAELDADLADAEAANDLGRIGTIKGERDALAHELAAALGLGGRARTLGDPTERARKAVSARLRDAVKAIGVCHAELGAHLEASLRTGTFCCYAPATSVRWRVTNDTPR